MVGLLVMVLMVTTCMHRTGPMPLPGYVAPDVTLATMDGKTTDLDGLRGHPVFLLFLAPDDGASIKAAQRIEPMYEQYGRQMAFIAFMMNGDGDGRRSAQILVHRYGIRFPVLFGTTRSLEKNYRLTLYPTAIWMNANGIIVYRTDKDFADVDIQNQFETLVEGNKSHRS